MVGTAGAGASPQRHPCPRGCFFKKETNTDRPEGQESQCQDEVSVWLPMRTNRPRPPGDAPGSVRWAGPGRHPHPHPASSRPQVTGDSWPPGTAPQPALKSQQGASTRPGKGTPQGSKRALKVSLSQPLFLTSGFTGGPQDTPQLDRGHRPSWTPRPHRGHTCIKAQPPPSPPWHLASCLSRAR